MVFERPGALTGTDWLSSLRRYMLVTASAHLVWEFSHMPLYTLWQTGTPGAIAFAAIHCTGGDILIALSSIVLALFLVGTAQWPAERHVSVGVLTLLFGLAYTVFSEWLNIEVRGAWNYGESMPVIPVIGTGLSPILQWVMVPLLGFWLAARPVAHTRRAMRSVDA